jgi:hypothetical protein
MPKIDQYHVDKKTRDNRYIICQTCESYFGMTDMCRECMCIMKLKTWFKPRAGGKCPKGKW